MYINKILNHKFVNKQFEIERTGEVVVVRAISDEYTTDYKLFKLDENGNEVEYVLNSYNIDNNYILMQNKTRAKKGELYYFINDVFSVQKTVERRSKRDKLRHEVGNYFLDIGNAVSEAYIRKCNSLDHKLKIKC